MSDTDGHREHLRDALQTASRDLDRAVLAVASGSLGFSLAFLTDFAVEPNGAWMLRMAWMLLGVSLVSMLLSVVASKYNIRFRIRQVDEGSPERTRLRWITRRLNDVSVSSLIVGVGFLVSFAAANV